MRKATVLVVFLGVGGCAARSAQPQLQPEISTTSPAKLCEDAALDDKSYCLPKRADALLRTGKFEVLQVRKPKQGLGGAQIFFLKFPDDDLVIKVKWKTSAKGGHGFNNEPRKELAAYTFQSMFLAPDEFVVPPTIGRCIDSETFRKTVGPAKETFDGVPCVFGILSFWVNNVTGDGVLDEARFERDPAYRQSVADLNLLTYLIDHRDTRPANFLVSTDPKHPRAFSIDNGLAFSGFRNPIADFIPDWAEIIVPALPRKQLDRLRKLKPSDLDTLLTVSQYRATPSGMVEVKPTAALGEKDGVRREGEIIQFGLTRREVDAVAARLKALIEKVDRGEIKVF